MGNKGRRLFEPDIYRPGGNAVFLPGYEHNQHGAAGYQR